VVHARKAWLKGLSPKENRDIPPLDYELVYRLKRERPNLTIAINGGVPEHRRALEHLAQGVDGVMLGRAAYHEAGLLGEVDRRVFGLDVADVDSFEAVERYKPYLARELAAGVHLAAMSRHMLGLFHGLPGARAWRRILTVEGVKAGRGSGCRGSRLGRRARGPGARGARSGARAREGAKTGGHFWLSRLRVQDQRGRRGLEPRQAAQIAHAQQRVLETLFDDQGVDVADRAPAMATLASLTEAARVRPSAVMTL
jgi:hypothetical protein